MREVRKSARARGAALLFASGFSVVWLTRCDQDDYPVAPTFCDEWCRVLLRAGCDQEPENCVRACEQSRAPPECVGQESSLLDCYAAAPPSEFVCSGRGFLRIARPEERVCQPERDALIECAYPEVKLCLDICRAAEVDHADAGRDAAAPGDRVCPSRDVPCDSMCWLAQRALAAAGADASMLIESVVACSVRRAEECTGGDAGNANWTKVLLDCAAELGL
jgi:hypothetical protein